MRGNSLSLAVKGSREEEAVVSADDRVQMYLPGWTTEDSCYWTEVKDGS
jgi:hypothetical protein